jgi:hypothetical protein
LAEFFDAYTSKHVDGEAVRWVFVLFRRPWTTNAERSGNRFVRQKNVADWRKLFKEITVFARVEVLTDASVDVFLWQRGRLQDTASCNPAVKSAIDGMVDGNLFIDDTGDHVKSICFHAPMKSKEDVMVFVVEGTKCYAVGI